MRDVIEWPGKRSIIDLNVVGAIRYDDINLSIHFKDKSFRSYEYWTFDSNNDFNDALKYVNKRFKEEQI